MFFRCSIVTSEKLKKEDDKKDYMFSSKMYLLRNKIYYEKQNVI